MLCTVGGGVEVMVGGGGEVGNQPQSWLMEVMAGGENQPESWQLERGNAS